MADDTFQVFMSYSHADYDFVHRLATDLTDQGINVWRDNGQLQVGEYLVDRVVVAIRNARLFVAVISTNYRQSVWCRHEIKLKLHEEVEAGRVFVLPIRIDDADITDLAPAKVWADFRDASKYATSLQELLRSVAYHLDTTSEEEKRGQLEAMLKQIYVDACYGNRSPADAIRAFRTAATMNPKCAWVWRGLGYIFHYQVKDDATAEKYYTRALALEPDSATINHSLAKFYEDVGNKPLAKVHMDRAMKLGFSLQMAWQELGPVRYR